MTVEPELSFGELHFGGVELGDKRRTKRLVRIADTLVRNPSGSLPTKFNGPGELDAVYHLMKQEEVTHASILSAHLALTRTALEKTSKYLVVAHDTTELDFTSHESLEDLGQIGSGHNRGYLCHNSLAVDPTDRRVIGLANQILWKRRKVEDGETKSQRREHESRESQLWKLAAEPLPTNPKIVDVCDRGADIFEFLEAECSSGRTFVVRSKHNRSLRIKDDSGKTVYMHDFVRSLAPLGKRHIDLPKNDTQWQSAPSIKAKKATRLASLLISATRITIPRPKRRSGDHGNAPLELTVVRVWEPNPPEGEEAIEWILLTNHVATDIDSASMVIDWYQCRWVVEEFHKAKKTGLNIEDPQFQFEDRLEPMIAILSVVAISLLNLRSLADNESTKDEPAHTVMHTDYIEALTLWRYRNVRPDISVYDFMMALAKLGGHLNRKRDGMPGWITLWRGWMRLNDRVEGARAAKQRIKCA